ncbi:hypothetical protein HN51_013511 [Arachis hypogaea]
MVIKIVQILKNKIFIMLNIFSLVCIHINSALYSSSFLLHSLLFFLKDSLAPSVREC